MNQKFDEFLLTALLKTCNVLYYTIEVIAHPFQFFLMKLRGEDEIKY